MNRTNLPPLRLALAHPKHPTDRDQLEGGRPSEAASSSRRHTPLGSSRDLPSHCSTPTRPGDLSIYSLSNGRSLPSTSAPCHPPVHNSSPNSASGGLICPRTSDSRPYQGPSLATQLLPSSLYFSSQVVHNITTTSREGFHSGLNTSSSSEGQCAEPSLGATRHHEVQPGFSHPHTYRKTRPGNVTPPLGSLPVPDLGSGKRRWESVHDSEAQLEVPLIAGYSPVQQQPCSRSSHKYKHSTSPPPVAAKLSEKARQPMQPTQTDVGPRWVCDFEGCGKSFTRSFNLTQHKAAIHRDERRFECTYCSATFYRKNDLSRHERSHTGERPYKCECGHAFTRTDLLTRHKHYGNCSYHYGVHSF